MKSLMLVLSLVVGSASAFAHEHGAEKWGVAELLKAQEALLVVFKAEYGDVAYDAIEGFSVDKNLQGTAANARVTYKKEGVKETVKFFCHTHDTDIDCH